MFGGLNTEGNSPAPPHPQRKHVTMGLLFLGSLVGLSLIIAACVIYAPFPLHVTRMVYQLKTGITAYKAGGLVSLSKSKFSLRLGVGDEVLANRNMSFTNDPNYAKILQIRYAGSYSAKVFTASVPLSQLNVQGNETTQEQPLTVNFTATYAGNVNTISITVPLWKNEQYPLTSVCAKIALDSTTKKWKFTGKGCEYPFDSVANYSQVIYNSESNTNHSISFFLRSADDPYLTLGAVSLGALSFNGFYQEIPSIVTSLSLTGGILILVTLLVSAQLYFLRIDKSFTFTTRPFVFRYLAAFVFSTSAAIGVGLVLVNHWTSEPYWLWSPFVGVWVLIFCCPISVISILLFWSNILKAPWKAGLRFGLSITSSLLILAMCGVGLWVLVRPGNFSIGVWKHQVDLTMMFTGIFYNLVMVPLSLLNLSVCVRAILRLRNGDECKHAMSGETSNRAKSNGYKWLVVFGIMVVASAFAASLFMPPKYNKAVIPKPVNDIFNNYANYSDIVAFYGFVAVMVAIIIGASVCRPLYNIFHYWIKVRVWKFSVHTTLGEVGLLLAYGMLVAWWIWYWMVLNAPTSTTQAEAVAIGFGQLTNLFIATLLFPVTRNSMLTQLVGISFERTVVYHKWLGRLTLAGFTAHMVGYWVVWKKANTLLHNMFSLTNIPMTGFWSVAMMELLWIGAVLCMGVLSYSWIRRNKFELFYYAHHFSVVVFIVAMLHSSRGWYFFSAGLILWFTDRIVRFWRGSKAFRVLSMISHEGGVTEIQIQQNGFKYKAGQYAFINIPAISALEWHPFSISSAPNDEVVTFHIKNMGDTTWTSRLNELCEYLEAEATGEKVGPQMPVVNIDGPYGASHDFTTSSVLLVAGGIGITPIISVLKDLWYNKTAVTSVTLLWVVKDSVMLKMFQSSISLFLTSFPGKPTISVQFYVTQNCKDLPTDKEKLKGKLIVNSRPSWFEVLLSASAQSKTDLSVLACGPKSLVDDVRENCYLYSIPNFCSKTFVL